MTDMHRGHWPEYLIEAAGLAVFMMSACGFGTLVGHPGSPVAAALDPLALRLVMGLAMGATAVTLIYSPWGRRSGAHFNPATTLTFWRLGKVSALDAAGYVLAQCAGGLAGVLAASAVLGPTLAHPAVHYVATAPGSAGAGWAFVAEVAMTFALMTMVLHSSNTPGLAPFTGLFAGALVATYIAVEAPVSGMSMNPARSLASAVPSGVWTAFWVYCLAPPLGMLAAAEVHVRRMGLDHVLCAKLQHDRDRPCIFRCRAGELAARGRVPREPSREAMPHGQPL